MALSSYRRRFSSPKSILVAARDLIERAWTKGQNTHQVGDTVHFCSIGAMNYVARNQSGVTRASRVLASVINPRFDLSGPINTVIKYNDSRSTRKAQVLAKFDKAIAKLS